VGYYLNYYEVGIGMDIAVDSAVFPGIIPMVNIPYFMVMLAFGKIFTPHLISLYERTLDAVLVGSEVVFPYRGPGLTQIEEPPRFPDV